MNQNSTRRAKDMLIPRERLIRASWIRDIATLVRLDPMKAKLARVGTSQERRQPMGREAPSRWMPVKVRTEPTSSTRRSRRTWNGILYNDDRWCGLSDSNAKAGCQGQTKQQSTVRLPALELHIRVCKFTDVFLCELLDSLRTAEALVCKWHANHLTTFPVVGVWHFHVLIGSRPNKQTLRSALAVDVSVAS